MTKVGIYAILRVNGTVFNDVLSQEIFKSWLLPIGLITSLYGVVGQSVQIALDVLLVLWCCLRLVHY